LRNGMPYRATKHFKQFQKKATTTSCFPNRGADRPRPGGAIVRLGAVMDGRRVKRNQEKNKPSNKCAYQTEGLAADHHQTQQRFDTKDQRNKPKKTRLLCACFFFFCCFLFFFGCVVVRSFHCSSCLPCPGFARQVSLWHVVWRVRFAVEGRRACCWNALPCICAVVVCNSVWCRGRSEWVGVGERHLGGGRVCAGSVDGAWPAD